MNEKSLLGLAVCAFALSAPLWLASPTSAQTSPVEQVFPNPKPEVDLAVQRLRASLSGRLPILEGFVETAGEPLDHYERGYYQCVLDVAPDASGATLVRATAKITAWYADVDPARSGYRVLPSNGRLERDLLARLEQILARNRGVGEQTPQPGRPTAATRTSPPSLQLSNSNAPTANGSRAVPGVAAPGTSPPVVFSSAPPVNSAAAGATDADWVSLNGRREETEKRMKELRSEVENLEEILHNQAHPNDLVVVRKSGTPIFAKPQTDGHVLFFADAEDEFEMLDRQGSWVHIQIAGPSRGWVRGTQVVLPEGDAGISAKASVSALGQDSLFRVSREETSVFAGDWEPLRGKTVRIIWVEPTSGKPSPPRAKLDYARSLLLNAYKDVSVAQQTIAGLVIVFDSPDGGQIAATLASLKQWQTGSVSEASFWRKASLDPQELFKAQNKP